MKKGCCGDAITRLDIVKNAGKILHDGHRNVAALYRSIYSDLSAAGATAEDLEEVQKLINLQESMARDSLLVLEIEK